MVGVRPRGSSPRLLACETVPIEIVAYDPRWPERYEAEAARLAEALGPLAVRIEHVGSTSVPGLAAKDVIDIQLSVRALEAETRYRERLECIGYVYRADDEPAHRFFKLEDASGKRLVHRHACEAGGEWETRHLAFRDLLRADPEQRAAYEELKWSLAPLYEDANQYADAKGPFIREAERRARNREPSC
jgi:GrpB-like predicted nucleotidyltransferase (UPF0157 family)